uniref:Uncharacterized protein n=1 Tax=Arundo donax TaxID=35708 RepID=A0A0A8XUV5_ARUDO
MWASAIELKDQNIIKLRFKLLLPKHLVYMIPLQQAGQLLVWPIQLRLKLASAAYVYSDTVAACLPTRTSFFLEPIK